MPENLGTGDLKALWDRGVFGFQVLPAALRCRRVPAPGRQPTARGHDRDRLLRRPHHRARGRRRGDRRRGGPRRGPCGGIDETFDSFLASAPASAEAAAVATVIRTAEATGCAPHLRLSDSGSIEQIAAAQERGVRISAETCPHLSLFSEEIQNGATQYKVLSRQPIRTAGNRERRGRGSSTASSAPSSPTLPLHRRTEALRRGGGGRGVRQRKQRAHRLRRPGHEGQ